MGLCCSSDCFDKKTSETGKTEPSGLDTIEITSPPTEDDILNTLDMSSVPDVMMKTGKHKARVHSVYDGDTMKVCLSYEKQSHKRYSIRLYGCDCPELKGETSKDGYQAKDETLKFIGAEKAIGLKNGKEITTYFQENPTKVIVEFTAGETKEVDKYPRDLARIWVNGMSLTDHLVKTGHAQPYSGGTKDQSMYH